MTSMNTLLTEPVLSPATKGAEPVTAGTAMARQQTIFQPRARILYVDDEPQLRTLGELALVRSGYDVDTAADGLEGWAALHDQEYHLLITDNDMPRLTGLELATQARLAGMRLPMVLTSGSADALRDPTRSWLGFAARLPKPFGVEALVETVEQILRIANSRGECAGATISVLAHIARVQPFPHVPPGGRTVAQAGRQPITARAEIVDQLGRDSRIEQVSVARDG
jgi:DNA-binding response OmpR family regulator